MIRIAAVISFALLLALDIAPASAQSVPNGSYQSSCTNLRMNGNRLSARCTAPNGQRIQSSTLVNCRGDIANANGYLRCNGGMMNGKGGMMNGKGGMMNGDYDRNGNGMGMSRRSMNGGMPSGSYLQSCTNTRMSGTMLFAVCLSQNGHRVETSINTQYCRGTSDIANRNGYLDCAR